VVVVLSTCLDRNSADAHKSCKAALAVLVPHRRPCSSRRGCVDSISESASRPPMLSFRYLRLAVIGALAAVGVVAGVSAASGSATNEAVERAALAPFSDFLRKEANGLCGDFVPAVAVKLFRPVSAGRACEEAAAEAFARYEVLALQPEPSATVRNVYARLGRAWVNLSFSHGPTQVVALKLVAGRWRVSSPASVQLFTCPSVAARLCDKGSKVLTLATIETSELTFIPAAVRRIGARALPEYEAGSTVAVQSGCLACHRIGEDGREGPGPNLTRVGARLDKEQLMHAVIDAREPMPSFSGLPRAKLAALIRFLALLR